jgi:hypothetical protein
MSEKPTEQPSEIPPAQPPYNQQPTGQFPQYPPQYLQQPPPNYYQQPPLYAPYAVRPMPPKKSNPIMTVFGVIGIIFVALVTIGVIISIGGGSKPNNTAVVVQSSSTSGPSGLSVTTAAASAPKVFKMGDTVQAGGYLVTLNDFEKADTYSKYYTPAAGDAFYAFNLTIESTKDTGVSVNQFYCKLRDSQGYEYKLAFTGKDPSLGSTNDLPTGQKRSGWVTFEVPRSANSLTFAYEPLSFSSKIAIQFDLGF